MKIGITGHQELPNRDWVIKEVQDFLTKYQPLIAYSSLAVGADQIFAEVAVKYGGELHVILPMEEYESKFKPHERQEYNRLLSYAVSVDVLQGTGSDEDSYLRAGKKIVQLCDLLVAVWNGEPAKGKGGTGDIVQFANKKSRRVFHINPVDLTTHMIPQ